MITDILEKSCVRITIKKEGKNINQGSGVIIVNDNNYYVLTAFHCLGDSLPNIKDIYIETQDGYNSEFKNIDVLSIVDNSPKKYKDWALLEIDFIEEVNNLKAVKLGYGFIKKENIIFYGYQGVYKNQFRPFEGKILQISNDKLNFQINIDGTFDQGGNEGQFVAQGLSGSGVYIIKNKELFLIGILNAVNTETAWNDDINCCSIKNLSKVFKHFHNMSDIDFLKQWEENLEKEKTIKDLENYKLLNNGNFENLERKNKVIYDTEEIANKNTQKQLIKHLSLQENIYDLDAKSPELHKSFKNIVNKFQDDVEEEYSSKFVKDNNEARKTKRELKNQLKYELEKVIPNDIKLDLADFQIIEWLLDCSLNFENR
ncbi:MULTISPECIES: trypsin-like peptidase domain-containing protein [Tenacibaculum]|uniref:Peptidase S1 domain-containing protein n=2 Tax=Tenacibaculum finnmarkense TaxID=2781243 RepID=A0A2I2M697_9FLAO|nr:MULTISPECIES: trypsin-like peptidase domain-containing protein [Tenacibaculum]MBE7696672.1 hypothetical protein [Tenacibaculum finnmarkense genomovar ulcerans]WBX73703.1 hypothetical protein PG913_00085 [Tenacibaculum pacificus]SOU88069.1 hypothetical protein TNO010_150016 [Tenacibaculum finnmarkense genomovar ulcerans]